LNDLHMRVSVGNLVLIGLDLPLITLVSVVRRKRKILIYTQDKNNKSKAWVTMLSKTYPSQPEGYETRHAKTSSEITDSSLLAPTTNHF
jgi:hypothetical protein